jgi:hypothetical protein
MNAPFPDCCRGCGTAAEGYEWTTEIDIKNIKNCFPSFRDEPG